ncbi:hypothetical protein SAMN04488061_3566 [Filomicrobium insigne]|uniref:ATPase n=1 Tax=Filomicrobium insigne TaxID=418854 RepID=A0A1H0UBS8_9HYPH|nr:hypothetical protein [Filomicrobium insigne]SDP63624.1 hypothetical protein SAMN04488061_3566 [Filomicrobium insigne]
MTELAKRLSNLPSFGGIDATTDNILIQAFEDHDAYKSIISFEKTMITGRKGSGKSAVYRKLLSLANWNTFTLGFTFSDYPWDFHATQKQQGVPREECYRESWKYFIGLAISKLLLENSGARHHGNDSNFAYQDIEKFVTDSYGTTNPDLTKIFTPGTTIKLSGRLSLPGASAKVEPIAINHLPKFYSEVNRNIADCIIRSLSTEQHFYICFDELDIGFDPNDTEYNSRLIGLIRAAKYYNDRFRQEELRASVIILLRSDIWSMIRFEDKNKLTQSQVKEITWGQDNGPHCLRELMERRFTALLGDDTPIRWVDIFDEQRKMRGNQSKYAYICDRGYLRPRDIIQFCNEVLEKFKDDNRSGRSFENKHVQNAEQDYSDYFLQELDDELHKHSEKYQHYFEPLKRLSKLTFSKEDFDTAWHEVRSLFCEPDNPTDALTALFEFSVVGYLTSGGHGGGGKYVWRYRDPRSKFNPDAKFFKVHLGLKNVFDLKLYQRKKK